MADECENLCRLCIDGGGEAVIDIDGRVGERINSCLPVKVDSSDDLPHRICKPCLHKVDTFYEFTNTCRESERRLIHMIRGEGAATSPSKTSNSLDRTATFVKQEEVDVVVGGSSGGGSFLQKEEEDPDESKSYLFQQRFVEEDESVSLNATSRTGPDNDDDEDEDEEEQPPPPKRAKRTAALKAAIALDQNSDDDLDDDLGEAHTKTEDQTDDSDDNFLVMPSTSGAEGVNAADQPGPSTAVPAASAGRSTSGPGTGADPVEAPNFIDTLKRYQLMQNGQEKTFQRQRLYIRPIQNLKQKDPMAPAPFGQQQAAMEFSYRKSQELGPIPHEQIQQNAAKPAVATSIAPEQKNQQSGQEPITLLHPFDYTSLGPLGLALTTPSAWRCLICGSNVPRSKAMLVEHYTEHKRKSEQNRGDVGKKGDGLVSKDEENSAAECPVCFKVYPSLMSYRVHVQQQHQYREFYCEICKVNFLNVYNLSKHNKKHEVTLEGDDQSYGCAACGSRFLSKAMLWSHVRTAHGPQFRCDGCDKEFFGRAWYEDHKIFHERNAIAAAAAKASLDTPEAPAEVVPYCDECDMSFPFKSNLDSHSASLHPTESHRFVCDVCGKGFAKRSALKTHSSVHEAKVQCDVCGKRLNRRFVRNHARVAHGGEKPYECRTCGKRFTQRGTLVIHTRSHTGERPFVCDFCGKGHVSRTTLNSHRKSCGL